VFLIYHPRAYVRRIPVALRVSTSYPRHSRERKRRGMMTHAVNWGCSPDVIRTLGLSVPLLNADISGSLRKMRTFELLDVAGLPHPRVTTDPRADGFFARGSYLGRKDGLSGGRGISIYQKGALPTEGTVHDFYAQVVSKAIEVRIHVGRGADAQTQVLCEQIKYIPVGSRVLIRNHENGATFSAVPLHTRMSPNDADEARRIAMATLDACGLDFAAVDMALTKNGRWVIFELNSAPGMMQREDADDHEMPATYDAYLGYFRQFVVER
jgi:hypothetical protein